MRKSLLFTLAYLITIQVSAQSIEFTDDKDIVTDFKDQSINLGESYQLSSGENVTAPGIYFIDKGNTYQAVRLSVVPPQSIAKWKPYLQSPSATSVVINWKDASVVTPEVSYGTSKSNLEKKTSGEKIALSDAHASYELLKVELTGLQPATTYFYKVSGNDEIYSFKTQPALGDKEHYRVLLMGDHHRMDNSGYEWVIAAARETVQKKYNGTLEEKINLVMNIGDQVDRGWLDQYERNHFYKSSFFSTGIPTMTTVGNHDVYEDADLAKWNKIFSYEKLSYQGISSGTEAYYAFQEGSILFIVMNTNPDHIGDTQLEWLKKIIDAANKDNTVTFVMSACHRPLYTETYLMDGTDPGNSEWLRLEATPVLGTCRKHVINTAGHQHYYHRGQAIDQNFYHLASGGTDWWQMWEDAKDPTDTDLIQKTLDYRTYVIIDFDPQAQTMTAEAYSLGHHKVVHKNILIDKFAVDLATQNKPAKPVVTPINGVLELPATIEVSQYSAPNNSEFNAAQYQIAKTSSFDEPVYETMLFANNYFKDGGPDKYIPTDTRKGKSYAELELGKYALLSGDYYIRVRYRNDNLEWSDWSDAQAFKAKAEICMEEKDIEARISIDKTLFTTGEAIKVKFYNVPAGQQAWIGIYHQLLSPGQENAVSYVYTDGCSFEGQPGTGEYEFTTTQSGARLPEGKYYFRLFGDGGYDQVILDGIDFNITAKTNFVKLSTDKVYYAADEDFDIHFEGGRGTAGSKDWIGVYDSDHTCGNGGAGNDFFSYAGSESTGSVRMNKRIPSGRCYWISYLLDDAYEELSNRIFVCVGLDEAVVSTKKKAFAYEEYVEINLSKLPRFPLLWLEIKDKNNTVIEKRVINDQNTPNLTFFKRYPSGDYTAQLVIPDNIPVSQPVSFTVNTITGIEEHDCQQESMHHTLNFYPNPVEDELTIENDDIHEVLIYSPTGLLITNKKVENHKINVANLKTGHYIMVSYRNNQVIIGKLYKK